MAETAEDKPQNAEEEEEKDNTHDEGTEEEKVDKTEESTEAEGEEHVSDKAEESTGAESTEDKPEESTEAEGEEGGDDKEKEAEAAKTDVQEPGKEEAAKEITEEQQEMIKGILEEVTEAATKQAEEEAAAAVEVEALPEEEGEEEEGEGEQDEEEEELEEEEEQEEEEEEEEEEDEEEEEEVEEIDRDACIADLRSLILARRSQYARNLLLQSKLIEYFRKNNMEYAYSLTPAVREKEKLQKYNNQLLHYDKLKKQEEEERKSGDAQLSLLQSKFSEIMTKLDSDFEVLQNRERELGQGLIYTKTGKAIPDKVVQRLLAHQAAKRKDVSRVRINYIKLRNYVAKKEEEKKALEKVGEGLHLMDYEQLRMENQSIKDKIEERDEELQRLRDKATSSISILAHVKEKSNETNASISQLKDSLADTSQQLKHARQRANTHKSKHDWLRREMRRLHQEAGLLVHPKLVRHFEETMETVNQLGTQLQNLRNSYEDNKRKLVKARSSIKTATKGKPAPK